MGRLGKSLEIRDLKRQFVGGVGGIKLDVHLCRRAGARAHGKHAHKGDYDPIHPLTMEFTAPQAGDMAVFRELREEYAAGKF